MGLSNPRPLYGIHSVSPYSRSDGSFYGILKVLKGSSFGLTIGLQKLEGGSQAYPWAVESGAASAEISLKVGEYPDFLFTLFLGVAPVSAGSSATGSVSTLTNKKGTSAKQATTGIASIQIKASTGAADLKFGRYLVVVASATTVNVYCSTDVDFGGKTNAASFQDDNLKVTASALTVTTSGVATDIPNTGVQLVGGSGTIGMTTGDTAIFEVLPPSNKSMDVTVGATTDILPEFGMLMMAQKTGNKEMTEIEVYRCKGGGMPIGMNMKAFSESDIKIEALYDSTQNAVFRERWIEET